MIIFLLVLTFFFYGGLILQQLGRIQLYFWERKHPIIDIESNKRYKEYLQNLPILK